MMDIDRPSRAAAALYDLKNEQLQLANAALQQHQQQAVNERTQQETSIDGKQSDMSIDTVVAPNQTVTTAAGGQQFTEEGKKYAR